MTTAFIYDISINFVDDMWMVSKWIFSVRRFEIPNDHAVNYRRVSENKFKALDPTLYLKAEVMIFSLTKKQHTILDNHIKYPLVTLAKQRRLTVH